MNFKLVGLNKLFLVLLCLALSGCSSSNTRNFDSANYASHANGRMVIKNAAITVEVKALNNVDAELSNILQRQNGYLESSRLSDEDKYYATVKVPSSSLEKTLSLISSLGKETSKHVGTTDVTDEFTDQAAELKNLIALRERLKALLEKAATVKEVLVVEEELNRVQTKIDQIEGRLKSLSSGAKYSTIEITLERKTIYGPIGYLAVGSWWLLEKLFVIQ